MLICLFGFVDSLCVVIKMLGIPAIQEYIQKYFHFLYDRFSEGIKVLWLEKPQKWHQNISKIALLKSGKRQEWRSPNSAGADAGAPLRF